MTAEGMVHLVGAGPGDPALLTVKALRLIEAADVIVHDRLVSEAILRLAGPRTRLVDVGKAPRRHPVPQAAINALLAEEARHGRRVVRLKGGDPFIFGRGGEEAMALSAAGVPWEVVPGITAAQGAAARFRIPLTHRGIAEQVTYVTGHRRADQPLDLDYAKLAHSAGTLVVYMGLATIGEIAAGLIENGLCAGTPVLVADRIAGEGEAIHRTSLGRVAGDVARLAIEGPCLFVIGAVAALDLEQAADECYADAAE